MPQQPHQLNPIEHIFPSATCTIAATGPCTPGDPDECGIEKELDITLPNLLGLFIQGQDDSFDVTWDTNISYPDQLVRMYYKQRGGSDPFDSPKHVPRNDGAISSATGLTTLTLFDVLLRVEDADNYGYWLRMTALTDAAWNSDSETVIHFGAEITHVGEFVLIS